MSESQQACETPLGVAPLLLVIAVVLFAFGLIAALTGEWDVALVDSGLLAVGVWIAKTPHG